MYRLRHSGGCEQSNDCWIAIAITISMGFIDGSDIVLSRRAEKKQQIICKSVDGLRDPNVTEFAN